MFDTMYNKSRVHQAHANTNYQKRPNFGFRAKKRRFQGNTININRFINKAVVSGSNEAYVPQNSFADFTINNALKNVIAGYGFKIPTPIQDKAIPIILRGHDIIGLANTGTGKTAAFLIPMIHKILLNPQEKVIVVVPTRELAIQIQEEFLALSKGFGIFSVVVVGGANIQRQIKSLRLRHNIIVGTPGRLKDLISQRRLNLSNFNNVILDEADRMLDMGFINDVKLFLSLTAKKRQTMLFSATFSAEINNLAKDFLSDPHRISIESGQMPEQIDQDIIQVAANKNKVDILQDLLNQTSFEKVLVFTRTKYGADKLSKKLHQMGFKADSIHGNKSQNKRQRALKMFKENIINILVATDIAARGLDVPNISHVINFDIPATYEDYIHRIGRTGRADQKGSALTFIG